MKEYLKKDEWQIIEDQFYAEYNEVSESIFSIGNGRMGQRANFEEQYSGKSLQGSYLAGIYFPDKTRVGWWKNGYPEYFAKIINSVNWIGLDIIVNGISVDLNQVEIIDFQRCLNMKEGYLKREVTFRMPAGTVLALSSTRFYHMVETETAALNLKLTLITGQAQIELHSYLDADVRNRDANYDEKFWKLKETAALDNLLTVSAETLKTNFDVFAAAKHSFSGPEYSKSNVHRAGYSAEIFEFNLSEHATAELSKYVSICHTENHAAELMQQAALAHVQRMDHAGFEALLAEQKDAWATIWQQSDIQIEGDLAAQQAIRFNIFQTLQTYTGEDARLNIGPKGFTGEKYGGVTYWDTEAYCIPFYLGSRPPQVAKNLLIYRYNQLGKAIENAEKLGFSNGAALYPMVTINGEECHNEWEITFEEIHRNGSIAFAIFNYIRYTGDQQYLSAYGLEVLIAISRFWKQRVNWSEEKQQYVMLGVTGPNEYENNVNNNWYTNTIASWCLAYTLSSLAWLKEQDALRYEQLIEQVQWQAHEATDWQHIIDHMFFPYSEKLGVFLQQDGYLDKEQILVSQLPLSERPLNQKWSWDRILRSCFIKQADVLQGIYYLEDRYDIATIKRNFDFYEARTVHESSLSSCLHAIIAAKIGDLERAYAFYLRTARLDLDDYNNDTEDGLHITSMAGTWMSIVEGFAGMRVRDEQVHLNPFLPKEWTRYAFQIQFRDQLLGIDISAESVTLRNHSSAEMHLTVFGQEYSISAQSTLII